VDFVPMPYAYETIHHFTITGTPKKNEVSWQVKPDKPQLYFD
jgi:hypothetical protein